MSRTSTLRSVGTTAHYSLDRRTDSTVPDGVTPSLNPSDLEHLNRPLSGLKEGAGLDRSEKEALPISGSHNLVHFICNNALRLPNHTAIIDAEGEELTYAELGNRIAYLQVILKEQGFKAGSNVLILTPPEGEYLILLIALLANRVRPVFIDPNFGYRQLRTVLKQTKIKAVIFDAHWKRFRFPIPELWRVKSYQWTPEGLATYEGKKIELKFPLLPARVPFIVEQCRPDDTALLSYIRGSNEKPKGIKRTHDKLIAQLKITSNTFPVEKGEISLSILPLAALHSLCLGITTVMPQIPPNTLENYDPAKTCSQILTHNITCIGGSSFFIERFIEYVVAGAK